MAGGSYGGGIQFITAARDKRVDVITPTIPWHNLLESLYPRQSRVKTGWDLALIGVGIPTSVAARASSTRTASRPATRAAQFYDTVIERPVDRRDPGRRASTGSKSTAPTSS